MPKLVALERFYYGGRNVEMGEEFDVGDVDVALLTHAVKPMAKAMEAEPKSEPEPLEKDKDKDKDKDKAAQQTKSAKYKTRDMKAED